MGLFRFVKAVFAEFGKDNGSLLCSAFAYTAVFSIGPLLLVLIGTIGLIFGHRAAEGQLESHLSSVVGPNAAKSLQSLVAHNSSGSSNVIALLLGIIGSLLGAAGLTGQLQKAFNIIFRAVPDPKAGIKNTVYVKLKNILLVVFAGIFVVVSLIISALINGLGRRLADHLGLPPFVIELLNNAVSLALFTSLLYLIYRTLPDVTIPRKVAWPTAFWVSILFVVGKVILGIIIGRNGTAGAYGAAASVIVLLLWFYYTAQILFLGAEGIKVYGENHKLEFTPKRFNMKRRQLDMNAKKDFRGRLFEAFVRGLKSGSKN